MILDAIIILIILLSAVLGFRRGLVFTLVHSVGWFASLALAYVLTPFAKTFCMEHTDLYDKLHAMVTAKFNVSLESVDATLESLPEAVQPDLLSLTTESDSLLEGISKGFTDVFFTILVFVALFLIFKIFFWIVLHLFSKDYRDGFANFADGLFGFLFGLIRGGILVLVLMALMIPLVNLISDDWTLWLNDQLQQSYIAQAVYYNNILLIIQAGNMTLTGTPTVEETPNLFTTTGE